MPDDPVLLLERELLGAARRRAVSAQPVAPEVLPFPRRSRCLPHAGRVAITLAVLIPVAAVIVAVGPLFGRPSSGTGARSGSPSLIHELGVLRSSSMEPPPAWARREIVRLLAGAEPGARLLRVRQLEAPLYERDRQPNVIVLDLVLLRTAAGHQRLAVTTAPPHPERVFGPSIDTPVYFGPRPFSSATQLAARGVKALISMNTRTGSIVVEVVPDGVTAVSLAAPGQPTLRVPVTHDVAAFEIRGTRFVASGGAATFTWYDAAGRPIRHVS